MLVTSILSISYNVFKKRFHQGASSSHCLVKGYLFTTQRRLLTTLRKRPFENIVGKEENAGNQYFLLFPRCFLPFLTKFQFFTNIYFVICKFFQFWPVCNFVIWSRVKQAMVKN